MASEPRAVRVRVDRDGVRTIERDGVRSGLWWAVLGLGALGTMGLLWRGFGGDEPPTRATASERIATTAPSTSGVPPRPASRDTPRAVGSTAPRRERPEPPRGESETPPQAPFEAVPPGEEPRGMQLFPPPGTKPVKRGLVVPDDFELPPGYVRHHQTTDDGVQLPPVLRFHPDHQLVDAQGNPIPRPADDLVPPELAPPGMPVEVLDVPEPRADDTP